MTGVQYLYKGSCLLVQPGLRVFVLAPLAINCLLFAGLFYVLTQQFGMWMDGLMASLPGFLAPLEYLLWPLCLLLLLLMVFFAFTLVGNLVAAPFNGFLAEKVAVVVTGQDCSPAFHWAELLSMVPRTLVRELHKLGYFLPRILLLMVFSLIPVINLLAVPLWLLLGIWMAAVQYLDYPADNQQLSWQETLAWIRQRRWKSLGFGAGTYVALLVPGLNLLVIPVAVVGATLFWIDESSIDDA